MMDDFIHSQGVIWLPHILRRLANRFIEACDLVFPDFGIVVPPRMVSTIHLLHERGPSPVTGIADKTGQSHPLIIKYVKRLGELGLVESAADSADRRRTLVRLTDQGRDQAQKLLDARTAFVAAYRRLMGETDADIFDALWRIEAALGANPFAARILEERRKEQAGG